MNKPVVAIVRYEKPGESVRRAVDLSRGLEHLPAKAKVFIKPNIVMWTKAVPFPKWGVITTSRVIEDMVVILKEKGVEEITIGEGMVTNKPKDKETPAHAAEYLGYNVLKKRYGVKFVNVFEDPFEEVDLGDGVLLNFNTHILNSDFVVNLPVMKTHAQSIVSLGLKNLKGVIDVESRRRCHNADPVKNLNFYIARLGDNLPPMFTLIDGIYTNERGPSFDGRMHRSDILVASSDLVSADLVGAKLLGYDPADVPHLVHAAKNRNRPLDLSDLETVGEKIEDLAAFHDYDFPYNEDGSLPMPMEQMGIKGLAYRKYDLSLCTYCSGLNGIVLTAIARAYKGKPFDEIEVLNGKIQTPAPGMKHTILLGKCMYEANKDHPNIQDLVAIKSCPPQPKAIVKAFHQVGIEVDPAIFDNMDLIPGFFMKKYEGKPEFDESHFRIGDQ